MSKKFKLSENEWLAITQGLLKKQGDGSLRVDSLMKTSDKCPFCMTEAWEDIVKREITKNEFEKLKKENERIKNIPNSEPYKFEVDGKIYLLTKAKINPFIVNRNVLHFRTLCCSTQGGPLNYYMLLRKCSAEEGLKFLRDFVLHYLIIGIQADQDLNNLVQLEKRRFENWGWKHGAHTRNILNAKNKLLMISKLNVHLVSECISLLEKK